MICPKCGRPVEESAVICPGCDFILDTQFLGEEILDEEQQLRPGAGGVDPAVFNLADAVILGDIEDAAQSFETSDSGFHVRESTGARLYVSGRSQVVMAPDAVIAIIKDGLTNVRLTPFEKHVISFIDGKRPVEAIRIKAGLDESEVKTALATLADKGVVEVVGRAFADESYEATAERKRPPPRRRPRNPLAGAVAAAVGASGDATDRAIEEAFRTQTGLNPLGPGSIDAPAGDDGAVFSSLSEDPLAGLDIAEPDAVEPAARAHPPAATGVDPSPLEDDDLPSDADSFDVLAATSEIEVQRVRLEAQRRGSLEPEPTNARRVLSDPELKKLLEHSEEEEEPGSSIHGVPTGVVEQRFKNESDGFDDFGGPSALDTAMLSAGQDSLSLSDAGEPSDVFRSVSANSSLPVVASPDEEALRALQRDDNDGEEEEDMTGTVTRGELRQRKAAAAAAGGVAAADDDDSASLSQLLDDGPQLSSLGDTPAMTPVMTPPDRDTPNASAPEMDSAAESLAEAVGGADELAALLEDSDEQPAVAPSLPDGSIEISMDSEVSSAAVEFVDDEDALRPASAADGGVFGVAQNAGHVNVPSADAAGSEEGTAAFVENPFNEDDSAEPPSITTGPVARDEVSSAMSEIVQFESESEASLLDDDSEELDISEGEVEDFHEAATGDVSAMAGSSAGAAGELFPDDDGVLSEGSGEVSEPGQRRSSVSGSEELISDDMIIRPVNEKGARIRGGSVIDEIRKKRGMVAASEAPSGPHREVVVEHPDDSGGYLAPEREEPTYVLADADVPPSSSAASELEDEYESEGSWDASAATGEVVSGQPSSEATNVLAGHHAPSSSPSTAAPDVSREMSEPVVARESTRHDADVMREKARRLFEDALRDFREGRVGAARMNAKLATIYDPANEEYRTALAQWGKDGASMPARQPSQPRYAMLYEEAQELESSGDVDGAIVMLENGARQFPDIAAIHNRLGVLLAIHKREYERAAAFIQRAIELDPQNLHYKSNLGKILSKKRQRRRANG